ncbi:unnamed protein product, partial [Allacma fusca]
MASGSSTGTSSGPTWNQGDTSSESSAEGPAAGSDFDDTSCDSSDDASLDGCTSVVHVRTNNNSDTSDDDFQLSLHIKMIPTTVPPPKPSKQKIKRFCCDKCPYQSVKSCNLQKHQLIHASGSIRKRFCSFGANQMDTLRLHLDKNQARCFEKEELHFENHEAFKFWKNDLHATDSIKFVKNTGIKGNTQIYRNVTAVEFTHLK